MTTTPAPQKRPPQSRTGLTDTGVRKAADKSDRTRAREFALQALYQHLVGGNEAGEIDIFTRDLSVVINECIELAKAFGGTDGHKWVNGVLNQLAPQLRELEVARDKAR